MKNSKRGILITGGAGYIGSRLIRDLATDKRFADSQIRIYDNLQRRHFCGLMDLSGPGSYEFIEGDVLDRINLERAMQGVSTVVHLAAVVKTPLSFDHPEWTEQVNHWGTAAAVECALSAGVSQFLYVSSASVYGPGGPFQESDPCKPIGPYASSKLRGEREVVRGGQNGLEIFIIRLGTVFGSAPTMRFDAVTNRFAYLTGIGRPITIHGTGEQVRPFIHVRDAVSALLLCLAHPRAAGEIINAVTMNLSVNEIAHTVQTIVPSASIRYTDQHVLTEISFEVESRRLQDLGFQSQFTLQKGLQEMLSRWQGFQSPLGEASSSMAQQEDMP